MWMPLPSAASVGGADALWNAEGTVTNAWNAENPTWQAIANCRSPLAEIHIRRSMPDRVGDRVQRDRARDRSKGIRKSRAPSSLSSYPATRLFSRKDCEADRRDGTSASL